MKTSWTHPNISLRCIENMGYGYFADRKIPKNSIVIVQTGIIVAEEDLDAGREYANHAYHAFQIERDFYLCPFSASPNDRNGIFLVNHSCEPTCGIRGQVTLVAMRDIQRDEQITYDYAMTDWGSAESGWVSMRCRCGSKNCRKIVGSQDWIGSDIQLRYEGYFSRYIQDAINALSLSRSENSTGQQRLHPSENL